MPLLLLEHSCRSHPTLMTSTSPKSTHRTTRSLHHHTPSAECLSTLPPWHNLFFCPNAGQQYQACIFVYASCLTPMIPPQRGFQHSSLTPKKTSLVPTLFICLAEGFTSCSCLGMPAVSFPFVTAVVWFFLYPDTRFQSSYLNFHLHHLIRSLIHLLPDLHVMSAFYGGRV
jgi:hypothetical protein